MTDHTTIQITKAQAAELAQLRNYDDEPYKSVIGRLLNGSGDDSVAIGESGVATAEDIQQARDEMIGTLSIDDYATEGHVGEIHDKLNTLERTIEELQR